MDSPVLLKKLSLLHRVFDIDKILKLKPDPVLVQRYYKANKIPYTIFHTKTDLMYMGISRDGIYKESDLLGQAKVVDKYIIEAGAKKVLELATGRGGNSYYLAQKYPKTKFYGVDISDGQLDFAFKKAKKVKNYFPQKGDYHDLSVFDENSFDVIFEVEALCYSPNKQKVIAEVKRVLKPGGFFILFDGYRVDKIQNFSPATQEAYKLMVLGMAVSDFESYEILEKYIFGLGLSIVAQENLSEYILPTLQRFENLAIKFLRYPTVAKLLNKFLPNLFVNNVLSAYLMPDLVKDGICSYMMTVVKK